MKLLGLFGNKVSAVDKLAIKKAEIELEIMKKKKREPKKVEPRFHTNESAEDYANRLKKLRANKM